MCRDDGTAGIVSAISSGDGRLQHLSMSNCRAAASAVAALGANLPEMSHLTHLDLSWNALSGLEASPAAAEALDAFSRGLARNSSLLSLNMCASSPQAVSITLQKYLRAYGAILFVLRLFLQQRVLYFRSRTRPLAVNVPIGLKILCCSDLHAICRAYWIWTSTSSVMQVAVIFTPE